MKHVYITIAGTCFYHGQDFLKKGMTVHLEKEPENPYDAEAILVTLPGIGKIGHVANSVRTVIGESMSAGRLYDRIGKKAKAKVVAVLPDGVLCEVEKKSLK